MNKKLHTSYSGKCEWRTFVHISYCARLVCDVIWSVDSCRRIGNA